MKITILGSGSAFTLKNYQTNFLLEFNGYKLLIDCGGDVRHALNDQGLSYLDIDGVYISHLHNDHIGGMEWLSFCSYFDPKAKKPDLFIHNELVDPLWDSLRAGLKTIPKVPVAFSDFYNLHVLNDKSAFKINESYFELIRTLHVFNNDIAIGSFGLFCKESKVFFTTDTQHTPDLLRNRYEEADLIFHDCETAYKSYVHAHYDDLKNLPPHIKKKMILVHYQDNVDDKWRSKAIDDGFKGFATNKVIYDIK